VGELPGKGADHARIVQVASLRQDHHLLVMLHLEAQELPFGIGQAHAGAQLPRQRHAAAQVIAAGGLADIMQEHSQVEQGAALEGREHALQG